MRWGTVLRNVFSNWGSYLVSAFVGFFLAPFILHSLGNTGYGLWTLVIAVTGYFGLLDLGIRSSVGRFVARYLALQDGERVNRTINTALVLLACGSALALLATTVIVQLFFDRFHVEPELRSAGKIALMITGLNMACVLPLAIFSAVLIGMERYDILSAMSIFGELARALLVVSFLKAGYGLVALALVALATTFVQYSAIGIGAKLMYRPLALGFRFIDRQTARDLLGFGIYRFIWTVANQLIFYTDSVVIGLFVGAGAITRYAIAGSLINYGRNIVSLATDTLYPSAIRMDAREDLAGLQRLLLVGTRIALFLALPLCLGFFFLGGQFIALWMGKEYASSAIFLMILTIPQIGSMSQNVCALILAGMAKHKMLAFIVLAEGIANLALSIVLVRRFGVVGVAWGTVVPHLLCTTLIVPLYTLRLLKLSVRDYLLKGVLRPVLCALPVAVFAYAVSQQMPTATLLQFVAEVALIGALFGILTFRFSLDSDQRTAITGRVRAIFHRERVVYEA